MRSESLGGSMAVKELKRAAVVAAPIRVTHKAYALAVSLFDNDADKGERPVTKDMIGAALSELTSKGVAKRIGLTKGRYGKLGSVKLLVRPDALLTVANRSSRKPNAKNVQRESANQATPVLTIDELEEFIAAYHRAQEPLIEERSRAITSRISELQQYLGLSTGDDFRNTMAMTNAALRQLDEIEHEVSAEVITRLKPRPQSPLHVVWTAMRSGSSG
jgi:hypothetical protein